MTTTLGERIATLREQIGMSKSVLGRRVGVTSSHIGGIERGKSGASTVVLSGIAEALGVTTAVLTGETPMPDAELQRDLVRRSRLWQSEAEAERTDALRLPNTRPLPAEGYDLPVLVPPIRGGDLLSEARRSGRTFHLPRGVLILDRPDRCIAWEARQSYLAWGIATGSTVIIDTGSNGATTGSVVAIIAGDDLQLVAWQPQAVESIAGTVKGYYRAL